MSKHINSFFPNQQSFMKKIYFLLLTVFFAATTINAQNVTVNPGAGSYPTLKAAFDAINAGTHTGAITVAIDISTVEGTTPATLNSSGAGAASYTSVLIFPSADGISVSGNPVTGFGVIQLKGADNVTIDGDNPNTGGTNRNLTVNNTTTTTVIANSVIRIATAANVTSADNITIRNCILNGNVTSGNASGITSTTGSSNSSFGIYCGGNGGATATDAPTAITSSVTSNTAPSGTTINNLTIDNNTINQCARAIVFNGAVATVAPGTTTITNNIIGDQAGSPSGTPPYTTPATTVYTKGIWMNGLTAGTVTGNTIKNILSYVGTTITAIETAGAIGGAMNISNNTITNIVNNASSACNGIQLASATTTYTLSGNIITNIRATGSSCSGITSSTTATSATISLNKITTVRSHSTGGWRACGITIAAGNAVTIQNNFIAEVLNIGSGSFGNSFNANGILLAAGINHKVYHNTVNLFGVSTSVGSNSINCLAITTASTQTGIDVRNNIFSNTVTGGAATDVHTCVFLPFTASASMLLNLNNNAYYTGSIAGKSGIGFGGTTAYAAANVYNVANFIPGSTTPATNWRSFSSALGVIASDNGSFGFTTAAPFTSSTDLHINIGVTPTQLESGGASVGVATDIDGHVRPGPAGSTNGGALAPDLGADEFDGVFLDLSAPAISYTLLPNTLCTGNVNLSAAITDPSGVNTTAGTKPRVYYKKTTNSNTFNDNTNATDGWKFAEASNAASPFTFTLNMALINGGVAGGDVIQYFVVAQDLVATPNVGINSGTFALAPTSVALTAAAFPLTETINSYTIGTGGLSGTVTIGAAGTYTSITGAGGLFAAINAGGLNGNVVADIIDASVTETGVNALNNMGYGCGGPFTLLIKPNTGLAATLTGTNANALIKLNGADNVTFDGLNTGGASLTIINTNAAGLTVMWIASSSTTDGANNNTIRNCTISGISSTGSTGCIIGGSGTTLGNPADSPNSNNTIQGNTLTRAQNGIFISGNLATLDQNWVINGNTIGSAVVANQMGFRGLSVQGVNNFTISNNTINGVITSTTSTATGIATFGIANNGIIFNNKISDIKNTNTGGYSAIGILISSSSTSANTTIHNNMIWDVAGYGWSSTTTDNGYGINITSGGGYNLYYNTINLATNQTVATGNPACLIIGSGVTTAASLNIRNNIFSIPATFGTNRYAILSNAANTVFAAIDYNDYYSSGSNLGYIGSNRATLSDIQTGFGGNTNSKNALPVFVGTNDLHLSNATGANWCLNGTGQTIATFTTDYDGDTRGTPPDIGADEFVATGTDIATPASQTVCSATPITTIVLSGGATSYSWTRDNTVAATGIAASGTGDISGTLTNTTTSPVTVTFTITPLDASGCAGPATFTATVLVNPTPTAVATPASQTVCSGVAITTIAITGNAVAGVVYNWTRDNTVATTGIAASGAGDISGTLTNTTTAPVTVTFTITPTANGCAGTPITSTVLVNPTPTAVATPSSQTLCSATPITTIVITGNAVAGVVYNWTRDNTVAATGIAASGAGNISGTLTNTTASPVTVTFTIIPTANGCAGTPITATVLVNPLPIIASSQVEPITCVSADGSITLTLSGAAGPYTFAWTGSDVNPTSQNQTGLIVGAYSVIVTAANGCTATANFALAGPGGCSICPTLTTFTTTPSGTACSGSNVTLTATGLTGMGITYGILFKYSTTVLANPYIGGTTIATIANGALTSGGTVATANTTTIPVGNYVLYAILTPTPIDPVCRPALTVNLTIGATPDVNTVANQIVCNNSATTAVTFSGSISGTTYNWTNNTPSIGLAASGTGNIASFTATNATNAPVVATITVTPTFNTNAQLVSQYDPIGSSPTSTPISPINVAPGYAASVLTQTGYLGYTNTNVWPLGLISNSATIVTSQYVQFTLTVPSGTAMNRVEYTKQSYFGTAATAAAIRSSLDGFAANIATIPVNPAGDQNLVFDISSLSGISGAITFRIYFWGAPSESDFCDLKSTAAGGTGLRVFANPVTCTGTPITYTYTVNPIPTAVATPSTQTVCSGVAITTIAITGNAVAGVVYNWTRDNTVATTGIAASGAGDISGTLTNTTTAPVTVTFTITPTANGCAGTPITSTVLVNPTPTAVATPSSQTLCSATPITTIVITGNAVAGVVYNWTRDNTVAVTGIAASGTGNSIAGTLTNTTALPVTVTFTIIPTANGCAGPAITATVLVNPIPNAIATPAAQTICNGVAITPIVLTSGTPGTTFTWTRNNTTSTTAPGGIPASGSGNTITGFMINTTFAPITVTFTITPTFAGCVGTPVTASVTIQPTPTAAATPATQVSCSGAPIATINLTGLVAGTVYNWTRDNVVAATGIAASGTGNISGALTTTVNTPVVVTFTITPSINGCNGPSIIAIDTIYPTPSVNQPVNQVVCNGGATSAVTFTGTVAGTTFNWTNTTPSIGLAATGTGNIPLFTAVNTTNAPVTATITVTPVVTSTGCVGVARTFTITVNPTATLGVVPNQTLCTGSSTAAINFTSTVAGTTFSWTNNTPSIGLASSGTGNIPSFTAINTTPTAVTATITVTPNTAAGCIGVATTVTITVNGNSVAPTGATSSVVANCGPTSTTLTVVGGALGTGASWRWYSASCGGTLVGTGASITIPVNTTTTYFVRAEGTCNTTGCGTSVTVTINTIPTISIAAAPFTALTPLLRTNLTATVNPTAVGNVVEWFKDNGPLPIATGLTLTNINVDQLGSYRARVTTAQGCTATSNTIEIRDSATGQLFVYPNPNNGKFQIRYYLPENSISVVRKVAIFDSKGALVYNQRLSVQTRWGSVNINILGVAQGSYFIKILDVNDQPVVGARVQVLR